MHVCRIACVCHAQQQPDRTTAGHVWRTLAPSLTYSSVLFYVLPLGGHQCHFASELHGLVAHPTAPEFITVGDDRLLRIWNIRDRKVGRAGKEGGEVGKADREGGREGGRRP